jgi:hypothetical protein
MVVVAQPGHPPVSTYTLRNFACHPLHSKTGLCYSSSPAAAQRGGGEKGSMLVRFFEAKRKKTVDAKQQMPHNLASLLLTNTTLRGSRQVPRDGWRQTELPGSLTTNNR